MSVVVKEVIAEGIDYWSPPLKKHRYSWSSVERRAYIENGTASGILMQEIRERERTYTGILAQKKAAETTDEEPAQDMSGFLDDTDGAEVDPTEAEQIEETKPKRSFRTIKRIEDLIYDDTAVKQGELEDEAYELLNADGFYDEILPVDYDEDYVPAARIPIKKLSLYIGILTVLIGFMIWYVRHFFF